MTAVWRKPTRTTGVWDREVFIFTTEALSSKDENRSTGVVPSWRDPRFFRNRKRVELLMDEVFSDYLLNVVPHRKSQRELRSRFRPSLKRDDPGGAVWAAWHDMDARDIKPEHIEAWVRALLSVGRAPKTVRTLVSLLSVGLNHAIELGAAEFNPCRLLPSGSLPKNEPRDPDRRRLEVLTKEQILRLFAQTHVPSDRMGLWVGLLCTGMRWGEMAGLRWGDLNMSAGPLPELMVQRTYDCRDREYRSPKTGHPRRIPVLPLVQLTLAWARNRYTRTVRRSPRHDDLVWPADIAQQRPWHNDNARELYRVDLKDAGVGEPAAGPRSLHSTRHTFASQLFRAGASWRLIGSMTHSVGSLKKDGMELPTYAHASWEDTCRAILKLPYGSASVARVA